MQARAGRSQSIQAKLARSGGVLALAGALTLLAQGALASDNGKLEKAGRKAYAQGDYKKAQEHWLRALNILDEKQTKVQVKHPDNHSLSGALETTYRRLGECALKLHTYEIADDFFGKAREITKATAKSDVDLDADCQNLSANYRLIDLNSLGPIAQNAVNELHPHKISVSRLEEGQGHHVSIRLDDDVIKDVGKKGVTQVGFEKNTSFDLKQGENGEIILANISGLKVHATVWINIINSSLKLDEEARPVALVTGKKLGFTQSVSTAVPDMIYLPVVAIVAHVKGMFDEPTVAADSTTSSGTTDSRTETSKTPEDTK